ncbi:MAG: M3 family metallopeptidase, partial [Rickettsiaceae bacterium]|nr:M3 family metallopeptidase [Rickettsiaceae bacterium]
ALRNFKLAGVHLPDNEKKEFSDLQKKLSQLSNQFSNNILDATKAWTKLITQLEELRGIPESSLEGFHHTAQENNKEGWLLTLEFPSYHAVITYCENRELRKEIYTAYTTRASDQGPFANKFDNSALMEEIIATREKKAKLLGYNNYAELSLVPKMAHTTDEVMSFLTQLTDAALNRARIEYTELKLFSEEQLGLKDLSAWDIAFASEKLRQHRYAISDTELRPYFSEDFVLEGMFNVVKKLFGIHIKELNNFDAWHEDVRFYEITDESKNVRGHFYLDLYARPNKQGGAWMDDCRGRMILEDGSIQTPIAMLTCNLNRPTKNTPALFTHEEVQTLFHEFGHGLHHMLTKINVADVAGINGVPWDAVEVPSQFLENWCWNKTSLDLFAKHYKTKEKMPDELFEKMHKAKNFQSALQMIRQLEFSLFDFRLHMDFNIHQKNNAQKILDEVRQKISVIPAPAFNRFQHSFSHIFSGGYAAGYYSYKWAEVLASDAFSKFEEKGIFDEKTGREFLHIILEQGGAYEPLDLFIKFRGREPSIDALLRHTGISDEEHFND